jgi:hypothetical protein
VSKIRGVSLLLEVIFGLGLFSVSLLMLFGIFPTSHRAVTQAKNVSLATNLARELLEGELVKGFANAGVPVAGTVIIPKSGLVNGEPVTTNFDCTVTVTPHPVEANVKVVVSRVAWREGPIQRDVTLQSYLGDF